jgi:ATP-dependent Clp protease ATP-binding subunit ClpB
VAIRIRFSEQEREIEMRLDKFTVKAQEALEQAERTAEELGQQAVDVEHLLLALLRQQEGAVVPMVQKVGADPGRLADAVEKRLEGMPRVSGEGLSRGTYVTPRLSQILEGAQREADRLKDAYIAGEHILLATTEGGGLPRNSSSRTGQTGPLYSRQCRPSGGRSR